MTCVQRCALPILRCVCFFFNATATTEIYTLSLHDALPISRNIGALNSNGDILFFIDADCLLKEHTLSVVNQTITEKGPDVIIGGTYTKKPYDNSFFSLFQSVFINYSETKNADNPDYIATHAMAIDAETFRKSDGFSEDFLPILEDVEFSHRLQRAGYKLIINPDILVQHIFNFSLFSSIRNAIKKSMYWTMYSMKNKDLIADSGTASVELKVNVISYFLIIIILSLWVFLQRSIFLYPLPLIFIINILINKELLNTFYKANGLAFALLAFIYYIMLYPLAVELGVIAGMMKYLLVSRLGR